MLLFTLGLLLFIAITGINLLGGLLRILVFFLILSLIRFLIKSGFYILVLFAVIYLGIKGIAYVRSYFKNNSNSQESSKVSFDDGDFVEVVE